MEYKCVTVPTSSIPIDGRGVIPALCDYCSTVDCTNPIRFQEISIFGVSMNMRLYVRGSDPTFVVHCEGFSQITKEENGEEEKSDDDE